jgi:hypothetical protein
MSSSGTDPSSSASPPTLLPPWLSLILLYAWDNKLLLSIAYVIWMVVYRTFLERRSLVRPPGFKGVASHEACVSAIASSFAQYLANRKPGELVSLQRSRGGASESNRTIAPLYKEGSRSVNVSTLDGIISLDREKMLLHVEPGVSMDVLARAAIALGGVVPAVVLEFPGITVGGAMCGGGIESSSFKYGSFHDTVDNFGA